MAEICVIGGTRYFGKLIVRRLLTQGHRVTILTRGHSQDEFGDSVQRLKADANDAAALAAALGERTFDAVLHQMCYSPIAALAASLAFKGRTRRLVMTSTIETYNPRTFENREVPTLSPWALENELNPETYAYDENLPWLDPVFAEGHYGEGKRQAEAALAQTASFPVAFVRVGHVLSDKDEFTGRFSFHVDRMLTGRPILTWLGSGKSSFIHAEDIAAFLAWATTATFTGAINACSPEGLDVRDLCAAIGEASGRVARIEEVADPGADEACSPFSFPQTLCMSTARAAGLGYRFTPASDWLPGVAAATVAAARSSCSI